MTTELYICKLHGSDYKLYVVIFDCALACAAGQLRARQRSTVPQIGGFQRTARRFQSLNDIYLYYMIQETHSFPKWKFLYVQVLILGSYSGSFLLRDKDFTCPNALHRTWKVFNESCCPCWSIQKIRNCKVSKNCTDYLGGIVLAECDLVVKQLECTGSLCLLLVYAVFV